MIKTRNIERDDFDFAIDVADKEGWEYERRDLERLAQVFPDGLLLAEDGNKRLGWLIACHYGLFVWIGSLVVHSIARRRGVGSALMQRAFKYADENGARTVALYAYQKAIPFYERIGLRRNGEFLLLRGASEGEKQHAPDLEKPEIDEILLLDRKYFRGDRLRLLEALREEFGQLFLSSKNKKSGYILPNQKGFLGSETMRTAQIHCFRRGGRNGSCADCDVRTAVTGYELWKGETRPDAKTVCDIGKHALCQALRLGTTLTQFGSPPVHP